MPKLTKKPPKLSRHVTGLGYVTAEKNRIYLGAFDDPQTHETYARLVALWEANGGQLPKFQPEMKPREIVTVTMLISQYWDHVQANEPRGQVDRIKRAIKQLRRLYGPTPATDFGPFELERVREVWITKRLTRRSCNENTNLIVGAFKWATSRRLIHVDVWRSLESVSTLKAGRTLARESTPVKPVSRSDIRRVRHFVSKPIRALIDLQLLTGARGGELFNLRACDFDTSNSDWEVTLEQHKTAHRGKIRTLHFGPRAQRILHQFMLDRPTDQPLFDPRQANHEAKQRNAKGSRRPDQKPTQKQSSRVIRIAYDKDTYCRAIKRGCIKAGVNEWTPHRLRHTFLTRVRRDYGLEAAQHIAGHAVGSKVTEIYAEANDAKAKDIIRRIG